jgi:ubiquinone biosynthesis protein
MTQASVRSERREPSTLPARRETRVRKGPRPPDRTEVRFPIMSFKAKHLVRYGELARVLVKHGRSDLVRQSGLADAVEGEALEGDAVPAAAEELAGDLEKLGPTFVKLGQLLSTRPDLVPPGYILALTRLQDEVEPVPFADIERTVVTELGVRLSRAFREFDPEPLASASLGQVHLAMLRDGQPVAVKVQRPGVREQVVDDLDALDDLAAFADRHTEVGRRYELQRALEEFRRAILNELDYTIEARNLVTLGENLSELDRIVVPQPIFDYSTARVLTMEYIRGRKITTITPLLRTELNVERLSDQLFRAYLKQILVDGFFHADPHPGNVFLTEDRRIALLDVGMVGRIDPGMQDALLRLLLAISEGRGADAASISIEIGEPRDEFDRLAYERRVSELVAENQGARAADIEVGTVMLEVARASAENGLRPATELTMLGKTLLNLDEVGRSLDPQFDPNAAIRRHATDLLRSRMLRSASPGQLFASLLETNEFVQRLPSRLNTILERLARDEMTVRVEAFDEVRMLHGIQKIANRIALGLVLAALIVGAAMLMQVPTEYTVLGYPVLAMVFFVGAALGGVWLIVDILLHDD